MAMKRALLAEDDLLIAKTLSVGLSFNGFELSVRSNAVDAISAFKSQQFDAVILDVNLPDRNGYDLCREMRIANPSIPIVMLTARTDEESAIEGIRAGADDYLRKPCGVRELSSRIERLIRKSAASAAELEFGSLRLDTGKRIATAHGARIPLGRREFDILATLIKRRGDVLSREEITAMFDECSEIYDRTIDSHLSHLRKKLKTAGAGVRVVPVYGVGYRLETQ